MPSNRSRWAAYNDVVPGDAALGRPTITFHTERLARWPGALPPLFVTLPLEPGGAGAPRPRLRALG